MEIPLDFGAFLRVRYDETRGSIDGIMDIDTPTTTNKQEALVQWKPPSKGWYSLSVDSAAKGSSGPTEGGAIIRDHRG